MGSVKLKQTIKDPFGVIGPCLSLQPGQGLFLSVRIL